MTFITKLIYSHCEVRQYFSVIKVDLKQYYCILFVASSDFATCGWGIMPCGRVPNGTERKENMSKGKKAFIIIAVVLVVLLALGGALWWFVDSKLDRIDFDNGEEWAVMSYSDESSTDISGTDLSASDLSGSDISGTDLSGTDISKTDISGTDAEKPDADVTVDSIEPVGGDVFNILLLGTDERKKGFSNSARSDSMTICSINRKTNEIKLISLERGMKVKMPNGKTTLITNTFHYGGPKYVLYAIENHLGLKIDKYIRINFYSFEKAINAVGGVDINLTKREAEYLNKYFKKEGKLGKYKVKSGNVHLNGHQALQYCRLRKSDSNWKRIGRQRTCIKAIQTSCKKMSLSKLNSVIDTVLPLIKTNLTKSEIVSLTAEVPSLLGSPITGMSIPKKVNGKYPGYDKQAVYIRQFIYGE